MTKRELKIHSIKVTPLYGITKMFHTLEEAIVFIKEPVRWSWWGGNRVDSVTL